MIKPTVQNEKIFLDSYKFELPFTVLSTYLNPAGTQWLLSFKDARGKITEAGWYHYRFEPVFKSYDPKQTGDTDDDV